MKNLIEEHMKILKILPIIAIVLLAASRSFSYAKTESDNDDLNLDSAFQAYAKEFESHNCGNRPKDLKLRVAKESLEQAIFPVLLKDKSKFECGFDHDVSSCKVLLKDDKIQLNVLSEEKNIKTTVNISNGIATIQEEFTSHYNDADLAEFCKLHQNDKKVKDVKCVNKTIVYTLKDNFSNIDLKNIEDELYCQCERWLILNHSYCGPRSDEN